MKLAAELDFVVEKFKQIRNLESYAEEELLCASYGTQYNGKEEV